MAVSYVGHTTHDDAGGGIGGSWNHSVTGAADNAIVVGLGYGDVAPTTNPPTVTVNAVSATLVVGNTLATSHWGFAYILTAVPSGSIPIAYSEGNAAETFGTSVEVGGVDQTNPVRDSDSAGGTTNTATEAVTVDSDAGDLVLEFAVFNSTPSGGPTGGTALHGTAASDWFGASYAAGASPTVTISRTASGVNGGFAMVGLSLREAGGGGETKSGSTQTTIGYTAAPSGAKTTLGTFQTSLSARAASSGAKLTSGQTAAPNRTSSAPVGLKAASGSATEPVQQCSTPQSTKSATGSSSEPIAARISGPAGTPLEIRSGSTRTSLNVIVTSSGAKSTSGSTQSSSTPAIASSGTKIATGAVVVIAGAAVQSTGRKVTGGTALTALQLREVLTAGSPLIGYLKFARVRLIPALELDVTLEPALDATASLNPALDLDVYLNPIS